MKKPLHPKDWALAWFLKAERDLSMAEMAAREMEDVNDLISFHAQQCAEKCLKGALVHLKIPFPKTHDLSLLYDLLMPIWPNILFTAK